MARGRQTAAWNHTSAVLAELMNGPRPRKDKRPWLPEQLHPHAPRTAVSAARVTPQQFVKELLDAWI